MHVPERDGGELPNVRLQDIEAHNHAINILKAKGGKTHRVYLDSETLQGLMEYAHGHTRDEGEPISPSC